MHSFGVAVLALALWSHFISRAAFAAEGPVAPIPHKDAKDQGPNGGRSISRKPADVPCWGLTSKQDPRYFRALNFDREVDDIFDAIDARIDTLRKGVAEGKLETLPDALSRSFFRHGLPPAAKNRFANELTGVDPKIPRLREEIDWNKIWLSEPTFDKVYDLVLGEKKGLPESLRAPFDAEKMKKEVDALSLVQLELLKERLLQNEDKLTHKRVAARGRQGDLDHPFISDRKFSFAYPDVDDVTAWKLHLEELRLYCPGGIPNVAALNDLQAANTLLAEYGLRRDVGFGDDPRGDKVGALHGLPSLLRAAFLELSPEKREAAMKAIRAELKATEAAETLRPSTEMTLLAHLLLVNGFGEKSFTGEFLEAMREMAATDKELAGWGAQPPEDAKARVLGRRRKVISHFEGAIAEDLKAGKEGRPRAKPEELLIARTALARTYLGTAPFVEQPEKDEMLGKAITLGIGISQEHQNTAEGARGAELAFLANAQLSPASASAHFPKVHALTLNTLDEKANPTWSTSLAYQHARHRMGTAFMEDARREALKAPPSERALAEKRAAAIEHLSKVDDPQYPSFHSARYQLARMQLDASRGTNAAAALHALKDLTYPEGRSNTEVGNYVRAKLLQARLHVLMNEADKVPSLVKEMEKELETRKVRIIDPDLQDSLARLQPSAEMQRAHKEFDKGNYDRAISLADSAIRKLALRKEQLFEGKDASSPKKVRDAALELDIIDLRQLVLRATIRGGRRNDPSKRSVIAVYDEWLSQEGPLGTPARHDRLLAAIRGELDGLVEAAAKNGASGDTKDAAKKGRADYVNFLKTAILKTAGLPEMRGENETPWSRPPHLIGTSDEVVERNRMAGELLSLLGQNARGTNLDAAARGNLDTYGEGTKYHEAAATLLSGVEYASLADLVPTHTKMNDADDKILEAQKAGNKKAEAEERARLSELEYVRRKDLKNMRDRQALRSMAVREYRLASGGDTDSEAFKKAEKLLERMLQQKKYDGGWAGATVMRTAHQQHLNQIANLEGWKFDRRAIRQARDSKGKLVDTEWVAKAKEDNDGTEWWIGRAPRYVMPTNPEACRRDLERWHGGNVQAVEKLVDEYRFGRFSGARAELAFLHRDAAIETERRVLDRWRTLNPDQKTVPERPVMDSRIPLEDRKILTRSYGAAMTAGNNGMMGWADEKGNGHISAIDWATRGWQGFKPDRKFYELYENWLTNTLKWGEGVVILKTSEMKVTSQNVLQMADYAKRGVAQIKKLDPERWKANLQKYEELEKRAETLMELANILTGKPK